MGARAALQDGNIHCHVDNLTRRGDEGRTRIAVAKAAYNAGERLWSEREGRFVDFGNRQDVVFSRMIAPEGAPAWAAVRADLWNRVDNEARRKDARLAKSIAASLTRDIPETMRPALLLDFAAPFVALGCVADVAIHEDGTGHNPHVHILLTTRVLTDAGFTAKITALEQRAFVKQVRVRWAELTNAYLQNAGSTLRVDHRSYRARGIGAEPTRHRGPDATERRNKREHARRVREARQHKEALMSSPDIPDTRKAPQRAQPEALPEPAASPDPGETVRDGRHTDPEDRTLARWEEEAQREPDADFPEDVRQELAWYQQAVVRARGGANAGDRSEAVSARVALHRTQERWLDEAAVQRSLTRHERALLDTISDDGLRHQAHALIHARRVSVLHQQQEERLARDLEQRMEPAQREAIWRFLAGPQEADHEDRPLPGPDGELLSPRERDLAEDRLLAEYQRDEQER